MDEDGGSHDVYTKPRSSPMGESAQRANNNRAQLRWNKIVFGARHHSFLKSGSAPKFADWALALCSEGEMRRRTFPAALFFFASAWMGAQFPWQRINSSLQAAG